MRTETVVGHRAVPRTSLGFITWGQLAVIAAGPLVAFACLVNFGPVLPLVREDLDLTNTWAGVLISASLLSHMLMQLPGGQFTDAIGGKRALILAMSVMGVSLLASGAAPSFPLLLLSRFALGVGTGLAYIAGIAFVHALVVPTKRALAQGIFGGAGNVGVLLVLLLSERAASLVGWRGTFLLEGIAALAVAWLMVARLGSTPGRAREATQSWGEVLRQWPLYLLGVAHVLTYGTYTAVATWTATFLWQRHGIGLEWAGPLAALLAVGAVLGRGVGGAISAGRERRVILAACLGSSAFTALVPLAPGAPLALAALLALGLFAAVPFGAVFSYFSLISERGASGRALSVINFVANVGAFSFPPAVGYALDLSGSFLLGFGLMAAIGFAGTAAVALWLPKPRRT